MELFSSNRNPLNWRWENNIKCVTLKLHDQSIDKTNFKNKQNLHLPHIWLLHIFKTRVLFRQFNFSIKIFSTADNRLMQAWHTQYDYSYICSYTCMQFCSRIFCFHSDRISIMNIFNLIQKCHPTHELNFTHFSVSFCWAPTITKQKTDHPNNSKA